MTDTEFNIETVSSGLQSRSAWLGVLSRSSAAELEALAGGIVAGLPFEWLRKPHVGLVMVRGRAGGTGKVFNLGEMTVTRCALRLADGTVGHGYAQGRHKRHAELAALVDALLQQQNRHEEVFMAVIETLVAREQSRRNEVSCKAAATKVEFFTMVRGDNPA